ncbi:type II toxin-antitoxin system PemK/MazF family toxin [Fumia xinanensis]|uniref:mRNA interferase n=1 Tax=Fumia xinanensis TaxID=2763659 RepID=A0A926E441_9FIRM|nr:type II toxin-antitoxin system PemK/MazF family toxin [Fumia xinanensis]
MNQIIKRGDLYYADLNPVIGSEQGGYRPVLVIQNDIGNQYSPTMIVAPITSQIIHKSHLPTHVRLLRVPPLKKDSIILLEQIRTIDRERLGEFIGSLNDILMKQVDYALAVSVGLIYFNVDNQNL